MEGFRGFSELTAAALACLTTVLPHILPLCGLCQKCNLNFMLIKVSCSVVSTLSSVNELDTMLVSSIQIIFNTGTNYDLSNKQS